MDFVVRKVFEEEEFKKKLSPAQYAVLRQKATEPPGSGVYDQHWKKGEYYCAGCGELLFSSNDKYDAGCGWPSFTKAANVSLQPDESHGMQRIEVTCRQCGSHLGHLFPDGPLPSGNRFCINSLSLTFKEQ